MNPSAITHASANRIVFSLSATTARGGKYRSRRDRRPDPISKISLVAVPASGLSFGCRRVDGSRSNAGWAVSFGDHFVMGRIDRKTRATLRERPLARLTCTPRDSARTDPRSLRCSPRSSCPCPNTTPKSCNGPACQLSRSRKIKTGHPVPGKKGGAATPPRRSYAQQFLAVYNAVRNLFTIGRHQLRAGDQRLVRSRAFVA